MEDLIESVRLHLRELLACGVEWIPRRTRLSGEGGRGQDGADSPREDRGEALGALRAELGDCRRCPLHRDRRHIVFGEGPPDAEIVFVGEAPGADEDRTGRPFVGKAGQLLTRIIEKGMGLRRGEVYICNILKCRPPRNRTPQEDEVRACLPFLERQIAIIRPRAIITLGLPAARALLGSELPMHRLRGNWQSYRGIPLMPTYHPAFVLRNYTASVRRQVWEDVLAVVRFLLGEEGESGTGGGREGSP